MYIYKYPKHILNVYTILHTYHDRSLYDLRRDSYAQGRKVRIRDMRPGFHYW